MNDKEIESLRLLIKGSIQLVAMVSLFCFGIHAMFHAHFYDGLILLGIVIAIGKD